MFQFDHTIVIYPSVLMSVQQNAESNQLFERWVMQVWRLWDVGIIQGWEFALFALLLLALSLLHVALKNKATGANRFRCSLLFQSDWSKSLPSLFTFSEQLEQIVLVALFVKSIRRECHLQVL